MDDLVARLRALVFLDEVGSDNPLGRDAADEIERLRGIIKSLMAGEPVSVSVDAEFDPRVRNLLDDIKAGKVYPS